jgi:hypothetical protein
MPGAGSPFERSYGQVTDVDVQLFRGTTTVRFASLRPLSSELQELRWFALAASRRPPATVQRAAREAISSPSPPARN